MLTFPNWGVERITKVYAGKIRYGPGTQLTILRACGGNFANPITEFCMQRNALRISVDRVATLEAKKQRRRPRSNAGGQEATQEVSLIHNNYNP
jgi:hypothetical protein